MEIIPVKITAKIFKEAQERNNKYHKQFGNTGTHRLNQRRQRMTGYLAEACIRSLYPEIQYNEDYSVDFLFNQFTIDSKAQGCNGKPLPRYVATLYEEQKNRNCDYYIFSRVKNDFSEAWICGIISKVNFFKAANFSPAGTKTNNFVYDQGRYEIQYDKLNSIIEFLNPTNHDENI